MKKYKHLTLFDFDGTLADTSVPSPSGLNVEIATAEAVRKVLKSDGYAVFERQGGLRNREPSELVRDIRQDMGLGEFGYGDAAEDLVAAKLDILLPEICESWPVLTPGSKELLLSAQEGKLPVDIAVVSSGHDRFIERVYEVNGLQKPEILVTSDIIRARKEPQRDRFKPNTYQLAEAHKRWNGSSSANEAYTGRSHGKDKMLYVGDDPIKDGLLAFNGRIPFVHVPFSGRHFDPDETKGQLAIGDFSQLIEILDTNADALRSGESFSQILFGRADTEVFPPRTPEGAHVRMVETASVRSRQERL